MKIYSLTCLALVIAVFSGFVGGEPVRGGYENSLQNLGAYGAPFGGHRGDSGYGNEPANYDFEYEVFGGGNHFGHRESRRDQVTEGKYHVLLPDGRRQVVTYIADETGYHPVITYEVVGTPFDGPSGGYGGSRGPSGGYGGSRGKGGLSGGYDDVKGPNSGYGVPLTDNNLGGYASPDQGSRGYGSRAKRQFLIVPPPQGDQSNDLVKIYKSERNPEQRFRNRRRRYSPKKAYLVVYPDFSSEKVSLAEKKEALLKSLEEKASQ